MPCVDETFPTTPKVAAFTVNAFPDVEKSPLSTIPQLGAFNVVFPLVLIPWMPAVLGAKVYKQPPLVPPLKFVATARAVIDPLLTPKTFMKYVA